MTRIYLDNAATTRVTEPVLQAMLPYFCEIYGNPSSVHGFGRDSRKAVENARRQVAAALAAEPREIYFTSGGTESDNWAIRGAAIALRERGAHIITSAIEHPAVLRSCEQLEKEGFSVTYLPVDAFGIVRPEALEAAIRPDTTLVTIMAANNEVGTIQPIEALARIAHAHGAVFHTDAVQAVGTLRMDVGALGVDMLSLSGHKFHAPKGIGALYVRKELTIRRLLLGGEQERRQRAGTENLASIVGLGRAIELASEGMEARAARVQALRDHMIRRILGEIGGARLNGHPEARLPGNVNVAFEGVEGESLLLSLDLKGIAASSGSACVAGSRETPHVLLALGLPPDLARGALRLSLSEENTREEIDETVDCLKEIVARLREMAGWKGNAR